VEIITETVPTPGFPTEYIIIGVFVIGMAIILIVAVIVYKKRKK